MRASQPGLNGRMTGAQVPGGRGRRTITDLAARNSSRRYDNRKSSEIYDSLFSDSDSDFSDVMGPRNRRTINPSEMGSRKKGYDVIGIDSKGARRKGRLRSGMGKSGSRADSAPSRTGKGSGRTASTGSSFSGFGGGSSRRRSRGGKYSLPSGISSRNSVGPGRRRPERADHDGSSSSSL